MKYNDNGSVKTVMVKAGDSQPIGTILTYSGESIPDGYSEISGTAIYAQNMLGNENDKAPSVEAVNNAMNQVVESGSNNNGTYIKFPDGTLICRGVLNISVTTSEWGSIYSYDWTGSILFPISFMDKPTITANSIQNAGAIAKIVASTSAIVGLTITRGTSASNVNYPINYIAIGRWK